MTLRHRAAIAFAVGLSAVGCGGDGEEPSPGSGDLQAAIRRYDYGFELATARVHSRLSLEVSPPGGECFVVQAPPGVEQVSWNGEAARHVEGLEGALRVCGAPMTEGSALLDAQLTLPEQTYFFSDVGFSRRQDRRGNTFSYLLSWVEACDLLGPCDDAPGRLARFSFEVSHAPGDVVLCPGRLSHPSATTTRCELLETEAPTYSAFAVASNPAWVRSTFLTTADAELVFYEAPGGVLASSLEPQVVADFMEWITRLLGPLPYGRELRFAGAPTQWLGFEHPANIVMREDLPTLGGAYANMTLHTLMHEVVHQWAGDRTTLESAWDFAWKEAVAEYLSYVYEDERRPWEATQTRAYWDRQARTAAYYLSPEDVPLPMFRSFTADVYGTGPMLLFLQLEPMLGRERLLAAIQHFLREPGARSIQHLRESLEAVSGTDLRAYFDAWVQGRGDPDWPYFQVSTEAMGDQVTITATQQTASGSIHPCAVEVLLVGDTQSRKVLLDFGLAPTSASASVVTSFPEPVRQVVVDPENRVVNRRAPVSVIEESPPRWML